MFHKVDPKTLSENVFSLIGDKWMLITAGSRERCNTMTASWGGLGAIWGAPAATCYIRHQRYTKEFVDREEYFTLSFFGEEYRKALSLCGSKSGSIPNAVGQPMLRVSSLTVGGGGSADWNGRTFWKRCLHTADRQALRTARFITAAARR